MSPKHSNSYTQSIFMRVSCYFSYRRYSNAVNSISDNGVVLQPQSTTSATTVLFIIQSTTSATTVLLIFQSQQHQQQQCYLSSLKNNTKNVVTCKRNTIIILCSVLVLHYPWREIRVASQSCFTWVRLQQSR